MTEPLVMQGERILVSGVTGQVGYHVARYLAMSNQVWGLSRFRRWGSRQAIESQGIQAVRGDVSRNALSAVPRDCTYVLHFAGNTSPRSAEQGFRQNVDGTRHLLEHCRAAKAFLHVSTAGVYRAHADHNHLYMETDALGGPPGYSPHYVRSKIAAEEIVSQLGRRLGVPTTIARLNCTYSARGTNQLPGRYLDALVRGRPILLPGPRLVVHTPLAVEDVAAQAGGLLAAARLGTTILNWGGDERSSALEWIHYWAGLLKIRADVRFDPSLATPSCAVDPTRRQALVGPCRNWKMGFRQMLEERYPTLSITS